MRFYIGVISGALLKSVHIIHVDLAYQIILTVAHIIRSCLYTKLPEMLENAHLGARVYLDHKAPTKKSLKLGRRPRPPPRQIQETALSKGKAADFGFYLKGVRTCRWRCAARIHADV